MAFEALEVAIQLDAALQPVIKKIARTRPTIAEQLQSASEKHVLALSEGGSRLNREQLRFWRAALGSVTEIRDCLRLALNGECIGEADLVEVQPLRDRSRALDWRLVYPRRR